VTKSAKPGKPLPATGSDLRHEIARLRQRSEEILLRLEELARELDQVEKQRAKSARPKK
jgi:hypothetical protein